LAKRKLIQLIVPRERGESGQSFVELALVVFILALLLAGVVEFGYMMNNYLHVFDAGREAARYVSSADPFAPGHEAEFYYVAALKAAQTIYPIPLNPADGDIFADDILVSVFSLNASGAVVDRYPSASGWSLCANYAGFTSYLTSQGISIPEAVSGSGWGSCTPGASKLSTAEVTSRLVNGAPATGAVSVEILYNYPQLLKLPVLTSVIPDPVSLYVYTVMPNSAAEPLP